jgi:hypothetical protein
MWISSLDYAKILTYPNGFVSSDSVFLQRYDLTIKDLDKLGWTLIYPPDERMKNMGMYPPYEK